MSESAYKVGDIIEFIGPNNLNLKIAIGWRAEIISHIVPNIYVLKWIYTKTVPVFRGVVDPLLYPDKSWVINPISWKLVENTKKPIKTFHKLGPPYDTITNDYLPGGRYYKK